jgi:hypothetical protein
VGLKQILRLVLVQVHAGLQEVVRPADGPPDPIQPRLAAARWHQ